MVQNGAGSGKSIGLLLATYNGTRFIDQTLAAIAAQTRLPDQIVLVDDASSDTTAAKAAEWRHRLPLEVLVQPRNGGVSRARNEAARHLETDLLAVLDGDDVLLPDHFAVLESLYAAEGGIASPLAYFWVPGQRRTRYQRRLRGLTTPRNNQLRKLIHKNYVFVASLVSRKDFERVGGYSEGERTQDMTSDWDLWLRLVAAGCRVSQANFPTVLYRIVAGSMADDTVHLLESEIIQLNRTRSFVPSNLHREIDKAIANRRAELAVLALSDAGDRVTLARMALGPKGGDHRNRARALGTALAPDLSAHVVRRRGVW